MVHLSRSTVLFIAAGAGLILFTPMARQYNVNVVFWGMLIAAMFVITGANVFPVFRNGSPAMLFIAESIRKAKVRTGALTDAAAGPKSNGAELHTYDGFVFNGPLSVDKSAAIVGIGGTETLPDADLTIVYSRTAVVQEARTAKGLYDSYFADLLDVHGQSAFELKRKSRSELRFGPFLNELIEPVTDEQLRLQDNIIKLHGAGIADAIEEVNRGRQAKIDMLERITGATAKKGAVGKVVEYFVGPKQTASQDDKPKVQTGSEEG